MTEISGSHDPGIRWRNNMPIDDNDFFREGTLRICGSLEIEKALGSCLQFLGKALPLDRLILQRFDESQNAMRTIAIATATESKAVDYLTPLSEEARKCAHEEMREVYGVYIFGTPRITSYNVCYTKLLRLRPYFLWQLLSL